MRTTLDMPMIETCSVTECAYNAKLTCHAKAITIGDGANPGCDTFMHASDHVCDTDIVAGVGACKVTGCQHNSDFECSAGNISVGHSNGRVLCMSCVPC